MASAKRASSDPNGRHVRIYHKVLDSPAYRTLGYASRALLVDMRSSLTSTNNGNISATLGNLKHRGWRSPTTLANALYELQALGFIAKTRGGGVEHGSRVCSLYRFTDLDCYEFSKLGIPYQKATHDYARFASLSEAERALAVAQEERKENAKCKKRTLQEMKSICTDCVASDEADATNPVAVNPRRYKNCSSGSSPGIA